jgi:hypothetical protein
MEEVVISSKLLTPVRKEVSEINCLNTPNITICNVYDTIPEYCGQPK